MIAVDGMNIHGDLMGIIQRAEAAGISGSEAATVKLAEAGAQRMKELLSGPGGGDGSPPGRGRGEGRESLAGSVKMFTHYTEAGVQVYVRPMKFTALILDKGWRAHGPVRARGTGTFHIRPFSGEVAAESRAEAESLCGAEVGVHLRAAGF